jgi:hypothetical protein
MLIFDRGQNPLHVPRIGHVAVEYDDLAGSGGFVLQLDQFLVIPRGDDNVETVFHKPQRQGRGRCRSLLP